jgi:DUF971 family protein
MNSYIPDQIINHENQGVLFINWPDGQIQQLSHGLLRARCKCAGCQQNFRLTGNYPPVNQQLRLTAIQPISNKGLNLAFSDGHNRGIYPWEYLLEIGADSTTKLWNPHVKTIH